MTRFALIALGAALLAGPALAQTATAAPAAPQTAAPAPAPQMPVMPGAKRGKAGCDHAKKLSS